MSDNEELRSIFCGNLSEKVTEELLYELFLQAGPVESVHIPKDSDGKQKSFGFVSFKHEVSVPYTIALMDGISLFGRVLTIKTRTGNEISHNTYVNLLREYKSHSRNDNYSNASHYERRQSNYNSSPGPYSEPPFPVSPYGNRSPQFMQRNPFNMPNMRPEIEMWSTFNQIGLINSDMGMRPIGYQQFQFRQYVSPMQMPMPNNRQDYSSPSPGHGTYNRNQHHRRDRGPYH